MKIFRFLTVLLVASFLLIACASSTPEETTTSPTSIAGEYLNTEFVDAASLRNQLAYGIMQLDGTDNVVTAEQASAMVPLWQAIIALSGDTTTADEELTAVQDQIVATLNENQLQAIASMQITNTDLNAFYAEYGIVMPTPVPDVTKVPGSGSGKTEEEKAATAAAAEAAGQTTGSGAGQAAKTLLFEKTIEYLMTVAG